MKNTTPPTLLLLVAPLAACAIDQRAPAGAGDREVVTALARAALESESDALVHGRVDAASTARVVEAARIHAALESTATRFGAAHVELEVRAFALAADGQTAQLDADEHTTLDYVPTAPDMPLTTEAWVPHHFTFARDPGGDWALRDDVRVDDRDVLTATDELARSRDAEAELAEVHADPFATGINKNGVVSYARQYWHSYNSNFRSFGNDCTNFASQALNAGGWPHVGATWDNQNDANWFYNWVTQTYSWVGAPHLYAFLRNSGRGTLTTNTCDLNPGDIVNFDWGQGEGISHSAIVTKKSGCEIFLTQHTNDRLDKSINQYRAEVPTLKVYGWKIKSSI